MRTPAQRTVAAAPRVTGRAQGRQFHRYHRVLSRAAWSELAVGRVLLASLVAAFVPTGPLLFGIDETLERRRGRRIAAKGISRDPVRSGRSHVVTASGLRWVCLMLLVPIPWAARTWALPVLTALAPSARYDAERGRRHKTLTDWARQLLLVVRRWWPERVVVAVADSTYAALELLAACRAWRAPVTVVTRLRLDAALYDPAPPRRPGQIGRPRRKGSRRRPLAAAAADAATQWTELAVAQWCGAGPRTVAAASATALWRHGGLPLVPLRWAPIRDPRGRFATQALRCTDPVVTPAQILAWFVQHWQLEAAFEEARRHVGPPRPVLPRHAAGPPPDAGLGWRRPSGQLAPQARSDLCRRAGAGSARHPAHQAFSTSPCAVEVAKVPRALVATLTDTPCYVA